MRASALIIADGATGIWKATRELWPAASEQRCTVHALRNITSKLPERLHGEVKARYWIVLDEGTTVSHAKTWLLALAGDYRAPTHSRCARSTGTQTSSSRTCASRPSTASAPADQPARANVREGPPPHQDHRPVPRRDLRAVADLGSARTLKPRLARDHDDTQSRRADRTATTRTDTRSRRPLDRGGDRRLTFPHSGATSTPSYPEPGTRPTAPPRRVAR
jgi:hypothetical protein